MFARAALTAALFAATANLAQAGEPLVIQLADDGTIPAQVFAEHCTGFSHTAPKFVCRATLVGAEIIRPMARPGSEGSADVINLASAE